MNKLVAVYGSLRKTMGNHNHFLSDSIYKGTFSTEPEYTLYSLGPYPGLKENGNHSVVMEVYEVTHTVLSKLNSLEGYYPNKESTFYDRITIDTPWGKAYTYIYVNKISEDSIVESGDWVKFKTEKKSCFNVTNN